MLAGIKNFFLAILEGIQEAKKARAKRYLGR